MCLVVVVISEELGTGIQFSDMSVTLFILSVFSPLSFLFHKRCLSSGMPLKSVLSSVFSLLLLCGDHPLLPQPTGVSPHLRLNFSFKQQWSVMRLQWWTKNNLCWLEFTVQQNMLLKGRDLILFPFVSLLPGTDLLSSKPQHTFLNRSIYWDFLEKITWESDYHRPFHWKIAWRIKQRLFQNCDTFIPFHVTFYLSLVSSCSV